MQGAEFPACMQANNTRRMVIMTLCKPITSGTTQSYG